MRRSTSMKVLIFGATGMLGHKVWQRLSVRFPQTFATMRSAWADVADCGLFDRNRIIDRVDVFDDPAANRVMDDIGPDVVINCIAVTKRRGQSTDSLASIELNAAFPHRLARWVTAHGARLIH